MLKICVTPMQTPNVNRWNIGHIGTPTQNSHIGHVYFMLFVLISFEFGNQREPSLQWNMGLTECISILWVESIILCMARNSLRSPYDFQNYST